MPKVTTMMLAAAGALVLGTSAARADLALNNRSGYSVQYTVYDGSGQPIPGASGCLNSERSVTLNMPQVRRGQHVYVRGEMKRYSGCSGNTTSDSGRGSRIYLSEDYIAKTFSNWNNRFTVQ